MRRQSLLDNLLAKRFGRQWIPIVMSAVLKSSLQVIAIRRRRRRAKGVRIIIIIGGILQEFLSKQIGIWLLVRAQNFSRLSFVSALQQLG